MLFSSSVISNKSVQQVGSADSSGLATRSPLTSNVRKEETKMISHKFDQKLAMLLEEKRRNYCVYALVNHTKKAIYFGVSKNPILRYLQHWLNQVKATKYWSFDKDAIDSLIVYKNLTQIEASNLAHALEKKTFKGLEAYRVIQTKGI